MDELNSMGNFNSIDAGIGIIKYETNGSILLDYLMEILKDKVETMGVNVVIDKLSS